MLNASAIVVIASLYAGILEGIDALAPLKEKADFLMEKLGIFPATMLVSLVNNMVFCNQVAMAIMDEQILSESYRKRGASRTEFAIDISNSGVLFAGLVPWSVGATVPMSMLDVGYATLPYCVFLYLVPLCYLFTRKWFVPAMREKQVS